MNAFKKFTHGILIMSLVVLSLMSLPDIATTISGWQKYQVLESHKESPILPFGYSTSMLLAIMPLLLFRIMNKRVPANMI